MLFSRTKKYVGILIALSIVLGCFVFNPEVVRADESIIEGTFYTVSPSDYEYQFDGYCAAYKFVPYKSGYYLMSGSVSMQPFCFENFGLHNMIAYGYRWVSNEFHIDYFDMPIFYGFEYNYVFYFEEGCTYYFLHDVNYNEGPLYGEFHVRKIDKYINYVTAPRYDALKDSTFDLWIELEATKEIDNVTYQWFDQNNRLLKVETGDDVSGITLNTNDYFSDEQFDSGWEYFPAYCKVQVHYDGRGHEKRIDEFPVYAFESGLSSSCWAESVGNPYCYVTNYDTAGMVFTVNAGTLAPDARMTYQWYKSDDQGRSYELMEGQDSNQFSVADLGEPVIVKDGSSWKYNRRYVYCEVTFDCEKESFTKKVEYSVDYGIENNFIGNTTIVADYGDTVTFPVDGGFEEPMQDKGITYMYQWTGMLKNDGYEYQFGTMNTVSIDTSLLEVKRDSEGYYSDIKCLCFPYMDDTPYEWTPELFYEFRIYYTDSLSPATSGIAVNSSNFPDNNFRQYVSEYIDVNHSGYISKDEIENTRNIDVSNKNISDLTGINYFGNLRILYCSNNKMSSLDVSALANLLVLRADGMGLTSIDLSGCRSIKTVYLQDNNLSSINIDRCEFLTFAYTAGPCAMIGEKYKYYGVFDYYTMDTYDMVSGLQLDLQTTVENHLPMEPGHIKLKIFKHPEDVEGIIGETGVIGVGCIGNNINYQWQYQNPGSQIWIDAVGAIAKTDKLEFLITANSNGRKYRCIVSDGTESVTSGVATVTVIKGISILTQPENYIGLEGTTAKFGVEADGEGLTYQWQLKKGSKWADLTSGGATTSTMSVKVDASKNGKVYRCVITDEHGHTATTDEVSITVKEPSIKINTQPKDYKGIEGSTAKFTVDAEGEGLNYQWQLKKGKSWANLTSGGATTSTMSIKVDASKNGKIYRCLITNADGEELATNEVSITVKEPSITITSQPSNYVGTAGNTARFSVAAEGEGLTYQWQLKKGKSWANLSSGGATTSTMSINVDESKNGKVYRCLITNADGEELASNEVSITIKEPAITIITQPKTAYAFEGDKVKFRVEAEGEGLTYQWQLKKGKSWADLTSGGATTNELTVKVDSGKFGKVYRCVITNSDGEQLATEDVSIIEFTDHTEPPVDPEQQAPVHNEDGPIVTPVTPSNSAEQQQPPESADVPSETAEAAETAESVTPPAEASVEAPVPAPVEPEAPVEQPAPAGDEAA